MSTFRRMLSDDWFDDNIIDMGLHRISTRVTVNPSLRTAIIAPLLFWSNMSGTFNTGDYMGASHRRYRAAIVRDGRRKIATVLHLGNHWISVLINFDDNSFSYGQLHQEVTHYKRVLTTCR